MDLQKLFASRIGVKLGLAIGRLIPLKWGYRLSSGFARRMAHLRSSSMVQAIRQNQWVVRGERSDPRILDSYTIEVLTHQGHCFIDLYHNLKDHEGMKNLVIYNQKARELVQQSQEQKFGAFLVAPHMSNFDLCMLAMAYRGFRGQVLSYGQPTGGYEIQNDIRAKTGLDITPADPEGQLKAIENMRNGGFVVTAVDRPIRQKAHYLDFFGRPSPLPAGHIRMAIEAGVPVIVVSAFMDPRGKYHIIISSGHTQISG
jgi:KDO2-lipid IV(A) lauroyltransferase